MKASDITDRLSARPFEPLLVHLRDGRSFTIHRPGMAIVTPSIVAIGIAREVGSRLAERIVRCPTEEIVSVEPLAAAK